MTIYVYISSLIAVFTSIYGAVKIVQFLRGPRFDERLELPELKPEKRYSSEERCPTCGRLR